MVEVLTLHLEKIRIARGVAAQLRSCQAVVNRRFSVIWSISYLKESENSNDGWTSFNRSVSRLKELWGKWRVRGLGYITLRFISYVDIFLRTKHARSCKTHRTVTLTTHTIQFAGPNVQGWPKYILSCHKDSNTVEKRKFIEKLKTFFFREQKSITLSQAFTRSSFSLV